MQHGTDGKPSANYPVGCPLVTYNQAAKPRGICRPTPVTSAVFKIRVLHPRKDLSSELTAGFENQLLYPPIQQLGHVEFGLRRTRDFVNPTELLELFA